MTSPQQKKLFFPSFGKQSLKPQQNKQSPSKAQKLRNLISNLNQNTNIATYLQSKASKCIKLNALNQVNSVHSSVFQSVNYSQQNSLRNIVNQSYFNASHKSIYKQTHQRGLQVNQPTSGQSFRSVSKNIPTRPINGKQKSSEGLYELKRQPGRSKQKNVISQSIDKKLKTIRSRSSGKLLSEKQVKQPIPNAQNINFSNKSQHRLINVMRQQELQTEKEKQKSKMSVEEQVQSLFTEHYERTFIKSLVEYMNKNWSQNQNSLLEDKKIQMLIKIIIQKFSFFDEVINDFMSLQFDLDFDSSFYTKAKYYTLREIKLLSSILFKQSQKTIQSMRKLFEELVAKLPQDGIVEQQFILEQLKNSILQIYDPKYTYSSSKMKERFALYYEAYCSKRTSLETQIKHKLKPQLSFIKSMEHYLASYQKQLIKLKGQISNLQKQKQHLTDLLHNKTTFKPIEIDFQKLAELKMESEQRIKNDFEINVVEFHKKWHQKDAKVIESLKQQQQKMKQQVEQKQKQKQYHIVKLENYLNSIPKMKDASTQIFNLPIGNESLPGRNKSVSSSQMILPTAHQPSFYVNFLTNIITPFTFNEKITCSLISIITIDKILYDYEPVKARLPLMSFRHYIFEWFIIRMGSKKVAQILLKNFLFSLKKLRNKHKRFAIFNRICGYSGLRKKNLQQDIEGLFYQSNLAWYYLVKLALIFRKKLNQKPSGYHIFPPINCQEIFKLSLRKSYELIQEFFVEEQIPVPENLTQKIDHYAINQISKFKQHDEEFQKQQLQEIHILRQMNFDVIAGFVIDYIASEKSILLEGLFRSIHLKQQQDNNAIGYGQFQLIYRKYIKEKRSKIELVYSKFCLCNMYDIYNAQNMTPVILLCLQQQGPLRTIFDKNETLKALIISQKQSMNNSPSKYQKKVQINPNSFQHFRERYYQQFYDFYDVTIMLDELFKLVKKLVKKKLKKLSREQKYIQGLLESTTKQVNEQKNKAEQNNDESEQQEENSQEEDSQNQNKKKLNETGSLQKISGQKSYIQQKLEEWSKIQQRLPHFTTKILTIDQIVVHNMRRKQMFEGCQFAWRTLRQILVAISK